MAIQQMHRKPTKTSSTVCHDRKCTRTLSPELLTPTTATSFSVTKIPRTGCQWRRPAVRSSSEASKRSSPKSRRNHIHGKIRLKLCEGGDDGSESSNRDILIFPDMIRYRRLTDLDVDTFVEDVLVVGSRRATGGSPEMLTGLCVFVCCHQNRDRRCGICGSLLVERFKEEIELLAMKHQVFVSPCSNLGGHQYAGNLIIFSQNLEGNCEGHWYGYVTTNDVPVLLDVHVGKRKIMERLWRKEQVAALWKFTSMQGTNGLVEWRREET